MKHLHMTLALLSVGLLTLRFIWLLKGSANLEKKWLKIAPHIIDTLLLLLGVGLAVKLSINPMEQLWLAEKLLAIAAYIFTGYYTLKVAKNNTMRVIGFLGALGWIMLVVKIATTKQGVFF